MDYCKITGTLHDNGGTIVLDLGGKKLIGEFKPEGEGKWAFPVGTVAYPPEMWYAATVHDLTGVKNSGYKHSGIDLNLDLSPWGDVDRGLPVWAVAEGEIWDIRFSTANLGCVVLKIFHRGAPLWVRYWHLETRDHFWELAIGQLVQAGDLIGKLGDYGGRAKGDHLHFDMAYDAFSAGWWLTPAIHWVDPVPILKEHLDAKLVDAMLARGHTNWP
jgi:murein DD-endopeptidase MepM/ murein hydrolase activator NlpD